MKLSELVNSLINSAEKGANIARLIRSESSLLELLVQEKKGAQKNKRFVHDFKTLADVLVQETVRYDLSQQFPGIGENIQGEESSKFRNVLGESITVSIQPTTEQTQALLATVLDDNEAASRLLAGVVHENVNITEDAGTQMLDQTVSVSQIGVWIDPIDSTAQYIQGQTGEEEETGQVKEGLQCVTVLIGVYDKSTGLPVIGVVNQPFSAQDKDTGRWSGRYVWGVSWGNVNLNSLSVAGNGPKRARPLILASSSESPAVLDTLSKEFDVMFISGAGYKLLGVALSQAEAYVLTKNSNFKWDCCGPHAVLRSCGGGILSFKKSFKCTDEDLNSLNQIQYHVPDLPNAQGAQQWCNDGGVIAYRNKEVIHKILAALRAVDLSKLT